MINQNNLSPGFLGGFTQFDGYIAANPTDMFGTSSSYQFESTFSTLTIDMYLGGLFRLQSFALWNAGANFNNNVATFNLLAATNPNFVNATLLLSNQLADPNTGPGTAVLPEVFSFDQTVASYVRLEVLSPVALATVTVINEVAFESLPEPAPLSAGVMAIAALTGLSRWRRQSGA